MMQNNKLSCNSLRSDTFLSLLHYLHTPLCPLVSSTSGLSHPDFPTTLLTFHLLTSSQLDNLAQHFHQIWPPVPATTRYPVRIRPWLGTSEEEDIDLATKRRRFGRFIGLRGCESPVHENGFFNDKKETLLEWMESEWQAGLVRAKAREDERHLRWK